MYLTNPHYTIDINGEKEFVEPLKPLENYRGRRNSFHKEHNKE